MNRTTSVLSFPRVIVDSILTQLGTGAGGPSFEDFDIHLAKSAIAIGPDTDITSFEGQESDFSGYTLVNINTPGVLVATNQIGRGMLWAAIFAASTNIAEAPQTAYGYFLTMHGDLPQQLLGGEVFNEPVPFSVFGDFLELTLVLPLMYQQATLL